MPAHAEAAAGRPVAAPGTLRSTGGKLERHGNCLVLASPDGIILPIWPAGTKVRATGVVTPDLRGRRPLEIGGSAGVGLEGRFVFAHDGSLQAAAGAAASRCAERGVVVEKARRLFAPSSAAELAAESDAVLVMQIDRIDFSDAQPDGFRTTIEGTVIEPLLGSYRAEDRIRVRHVQGQDAGGNWNLTAHSMHFPNHKPGDRLLLFVNRDFYLDQAQARGGQPLRAHVGAGGGLFRLNGDRILNDADIRMPDTLAEFRRLLRGR